MTLIKNYEIIQEQHVLFVYVRILWIVRKEETRPNLEFRLRTIKLNMDLGRDTEALVLGWMWFFSCLKTL